MDVPPWTQRLVIRWRSDLRFYEERFAVLRALEGFGLLRAFQVTENQISARLGDESHEFLLDSASLTIRALKPGADMEGLTRATGATFDAIRPKRVRPQLALQHLIEVEADYDAHRRRTVQTWFPTAPLDILTLTDWAMMLTGRVPSAMLSAEFGIVSRREIPARLSREIGRIGLDQGVASSFWEEMDLPDVAFFCDSVWNREEELDSDSLTEEFTAFWDETLKHSGQLAIRLHERVVEGNGSSSVLAEDVETSMEGGA